MSRLLTLLALCAVGAALPPVRWGFRLWIVLVLPVATLLILTPTPQMWDDDFAKGLGQLIALMVLAVMVGGVGLRWLLKRTLIPASERTLPLGDNEIRALRLFDGILAVVAGLCAGLFLVLGVALLLRGLSGGLLVHMAIFVLTLGLAGWLHLHAGGLVRPAAVATLSVLAGMALLGGLYWPSPGSEDLRRGNPKVRQMHPGGEPVRRTPLRSA